MQLHPLFATVSRPVYHDRHGCLFLPVECPECKGAGEMSYSTLGLSHPSSRSETCAFETCNGMGEVYEQVSEDDL